MKKILFAFIFAILLIGIVSASFSIGNLSHSIDKQYRPTDNIRGWINISLENEPINSLFSSNYNNYINLLDLILSNGENSLDYDCTPSDCTVDYSSVSGTGETSKEQLLNADETIVYGLKITGGYVEEISNFSISISSNAGEWYDPQLYIDVFGDSIVEWQAHESSGNFLSENYGCYQAPADNTAKLYSAPYCEQISLSASPNVKIGAKVNEANPVGENVEFLMTIEGKNNSVYDSCFATATGTGKISCIPETQIPEKGDYFVCISTKTSSDNNKYTINHESTDVCGYTNYYANSFSRDFEIFARTATYGSLGNFNLNNDELYNSGIYTYNIEDDIWNYLGRRYNRDCTDECIIPIKLISNYGKSTTNDGDNLNPNVISEQPHTITLSNIVLEYTTDIRETSNQLYDLVEIPAKINSDFITLALNEGEFSVPDEYGNATFRLRLNNQEVFSDLITIQKYPEIEFLVPRKTAATVNTTFRVGIKPTNDANITSYKWNFGDNSSLTTSNNEATHAYNSVGTYLLTINVTDTNDLTSVEQFNITIESPKNLIGTTLTTKKNDLDSIKLDIKDFTIFQKASLEDIFNLTKIENTLNQIQITYDATTNITEEQVYIDMIKSLLEINLPESLDITKNANSIIFYPLEENIDISVVSSVQGEDYSNSKENDYINSILFWNQDNLATTVDYDEITATYPYFEEPVLRTFSFEINKNYVSDENPYFFIKALENLKFKESYLQKEQQGYYSIEIVGNSKKIEFSTTEQYDFVDIPAFSSPSLSNLNLVDTTPPGEEIEWKWALLGLIIVLALLVGFGLYSFLRNWYKTKYEIHLFKNKTDLYNLVNYINRMIKKGMKNDEIEDNLRRSRWNNEQIRYAMKKYAKKNTGIFEIPIEKILGLVKEKSGKKTDRKY